VFFALFGTVYAGFEAASRMLYETGKTLTNRVEKISYNKFTLYFMIYLLSLGIPTAIFMRGGLSVLFVLSLTLLFVGVIGVVIYGVGVLYISQKYLPERYKLGKLSLIISLLGVIMLLIPMLFFLI
jgi:hypothetical protein